MKIKSEEITLITPPFTQLSSPYPAVPFLSGTLNYYKISNTIIDLSIETAVKFFSKEGLKRLFFQIENSGSKIKNETRNFINRKNEYINTIDSVINFLQGNNSGISYKIAGRKYLPENKRFEILSNFEFDDFNITDYAKLISSLYIDDICDLAGNTVLPQFGLNSYNVKLAPSSASFDSIYEELKKDDLISEIMNETICGYDFSKTKLVVITIPFPGNIYGGLKLAQILKNNYKNIKIAVGGGYINTELKFISDTRIFEFIDFVCQDNGELPLLRIIDFINEKIDSAKLVRTMILENGNIILKNDCEAKDIYGKEAGYPDYKKLPLEKYFSIIETTNPMHKLWSEKGFLKIRMASGCYHHKCTFCDTKLQYINEYKPLQADELIFQIEKVIEETGIRCFHFVDEAMPPALVKHFSLELIKRRISITWWGNIRFEKLYSAGLCRLMKDAGCIAVTGGLESANNRILNLMEKRLSISTSIKTCSNFKQAGILTHGYLIYGFPSETIEECINSLEIIRQMFMCKILDSAFYHRFSLTIHSPVYKNPRKYGISFVEKESAFAKNDIEYIDKFQTGIDKISTGLNKALYNFNYKNCLNDKITNWFGFNVNISIPKNYVSKIINENNKDDFSKNILWLGTKPYIKRSSTNYSILTIPKNIENLEYELPDKLAEWIFNLIENISIYENDKNQKITLSDIEKTFPSQEAGCLFIDFLENDLWFDLEESGLIVI